MSSERTVLSHFRHHARQHPASLAVTDGELSLSYAELDARSDALAGVLSARGIGPGSLVPLLADRSAHLIVGLLGVAKSGAAYVPVDRAYPEQRRRYIVSQTGSRLVLSTSAAVSPDGAECLDISRIPRGPAASVAAAVDPRSAAYVIFTSGTTGAPKGVVVEHGALENLIAWHNAEFRVDAQSRLTLMAKIGFDVSQWEIWSALCSGASLHILDDDARVDADAVARFYARHGISHAFAPPSWFPT